jgi:hypothetical protein
MNAFFWRNEVQEIQGIITAVDTAFREFAATSPTRDVRRSVSNAVKLLIADLTSIDWSATNTPEHWKER